MMNPGFEIIQSNRFELLAGRLCDDLSKAPLSSPLAKEIVLVQDPSVGKWLEMFIARRSGVAANLRFLNPGQFIADLYRSLDPSLRTGSPFDPEVLQWRVFAVLGERGFIDNHPELATFLKGGDAGRTFDLASRIATVFDRYLVYRMDWLADWEAGREGRRGRDELWQAALWRKVTQAIPEARHGALYNRLRGALEKGFAGVPERVNVFGVSSLSPAYAALLRAAGSHAAVQVYVVNPCREEWGEIVSERNVADLDYTPELLHFDVPHSLLGSLGKQGRDFMSIVYERAGEGSGTVDLFESPPGKEPLLQCVQAGILNLVEEKIPHRPDDRSVQVHRCHTPMREVQVLRDRLLDLFEKDPALKPSDIMVLAPDINIYAPYIDAVFSPQPEGTVSIPYEIADRTPAQMDPVVEAWLALLDLPKSRFEADIVVGLLRLAPIASAFRISPEEINRLTEWVEQSGIRWGIDGGQKRTLGLPPDDAFTWSWGLDRLVLGVALPQASAGGGLFHGFLPSDRVEGQEVELLDRFVRFASTLKEWVEYLRQPRTMEQWGASLGAWLDRFFPGGREISEQREEIRASIEGTVSGCGRALYAEPVECSVIRKFMQAALGENRQGLRFYSGGVVFCTMRPMRALPFRVIYLLGLSDGEFPRERHTPSFDLMRRYYRHGDRSGRQDDRYLFLELLLSARDTLIVSYVGEDVYTGKNLPPSPILGEFLDFIGKIAFADPVDGADRTMPRERAERDLLVRHPLQSFSGRYFDGMDDRLFSYSDDERRTSAAIRSGPTGERILFAEPLPPPAETSRSVRLDDLCDFTGNPTKYLFNKRLNIYYRNDDDVLEGSEPLVVGKAETRMIRSALVEGVGRGQVRDAAGKEELFVRLRADAKLPLGMPGRTGFSSGVEEMVPVLEAYRALLRKQSLPGIAKKLRIGDREIEVELSSGLTADGCYEVKPGELRGKDILPFWVRSLAVSLAHPNSATGGLVASLLGITRNARKEIQADLREFRQDAKAGEILEELLRWYDVGLRRPIHFFPESSWAYAEVSGADDDRTKALEKAKLKWIPADDDRGFREAQDEYYRQVFPPDETALDQEFVQLTDLFAVRAFRSLVAVAKPRKKKS